ncbi:MAG: FprA family A-type flavoprotein [Anaerolineae bacterium]|nr:FprA family A-type flavoprotein [Anaerolineae bacterium]
MKLRRIREGVYWLGAVDWDRRLFDALIPLPDGTSYNAYLVQGSEKTALLDTVDPSRVHLLMAQLEGVPRVDYIVAHHAEQDHSGAIPHVLQKYPQARVLASAKGKPMLADHLGIPLDAVDVVEDGVTLSLGGKTLQFLYTPWVHWPETMSTYLQEDRILFSCDFFGSHLATTDLYVTDPARVYEAAKRYYAEIMMPFRRAIRGNLQKVSALEVDLIAPSHGPVYDDPAFIMEAYGDWISDEPKNEVVLPYVSMHGSTARMVEFLVAALAERGVRVHQFDLSVTDLGKLAISLVDAATLIVGTPTVLAGAHPHVASAAYLVNALRPKLRFVSVIGSYGWGGKAVDQIVGLLPNLKAEILEPVLCKGLPQEDDFAALERLADTVAAKHRELGLL